MQNYYDVLGLSKNASYEEIKNSFKNLAIKYHPDKNPNKDTSQIFKNITVAYKTLSNPYKRGKYDSMLEQKDYVNINNMFDMDIFSALRSFEQIFNKVRSTHHKNNNDFFFETQFPENLLKNNRNINNRYYQIYSSHALNNNGETSVKRSYKINNNGKKDYYNEEYIKKNGKTTYRKVSGNPKLMNMSSPDLINGYKKGRHGKTYKLIN